MSHELVMDVAAPPDDLIFVGGVREYRANCQVGQFVVGNEMKGSKLIMEVIGAMPIEAALFNYPYQKWLIVIFADQQRVVSRVLFKTESLDNFLETFRQVTAEKPFNSVQIECSMQKRSGTIKDERGEAKPVNYFAVEFAVSGPAKHIDSVKRFKAVHGAQFGAEMYAIEKPVAPPPVTAMVDVNTGEILTAPATRAIAKS